MTELIDQNIILSTIDCDSFIIEMNRIVGITDYYLDKLTI